MMDVRVVCDGCKHEFCLNAITIKEEPVEVKGNKLTLNFFTCPKCNRIYKVCLKDSRYEELQNDLEEIKKRIRKNSGRKNIRVAGVLNDLVLKKQEKLRKHMEKLDNKYPGTFTLIASENNEQDKQLNYHESMDSEEKQK